MTTDQTAEPASRSATAAGSVSYAIFDQALWTRFSEATSVNAYLGAWLALLCRTIDGAEAAVTVLGEPDTGPFSPAAHWPDEDGVPPWLMAVAERCLGKRQPVMAEEGASNYVALPLTMNGHLYGVTAIAVGAKGCTPPDVIRLLRWGTGWIEVLLRREEGRSAEKLQLRTAAALDMLAVVLEQKRLDRAANALVTELAQKLDCDPVSLGFVRRGQARVRAVSQAAAFGKRMSLMRDIRAAMNEAIDQDAVVLYPIKDEWEYRVTQAHAEIVRMHKADHVLTVPIQHDGEIIGALTLQKTGAEGFDEDTVQLVDATATIVGPVLEEKRRNDRWLIVKAAEVLGHQLVRLLGPSHFGRKLATLAFFALAWFFATTTTTFTIPAPATLQGTVQRTIVAPFNGYVADEQVQAGAIVAEGALMARLDDRDLALERLRLTTSRSQRRAEYDQALAARERAQANIIETQIRQIDSQIALMDEQIARTEIRAPFVGVVVSGDLSQSIGATVERGEELFRIAPLDGYRVVMEVDEGDLTYIEQGQTGQLRVTSLPDVPLEYEITRITPISDQREGRNFFRVDATLLDNDPRLRPSMEGVARTRIDERLLFEVWTRPLVDWARLAFWRWKP